MADQITSKIHSPFPGIWKIQFGAVSSPTLLEYSGVAPKAQALEKSDAVHLPIETEDVTAYRSSGKTVISVPLTPDEKLYGFGLQYQSIEHRCQLFELRVDHYKGRDDGRTHAPIPFCISSRGYGIFFNAAAKMLVYAGRTHRKEQHPEIRSRRDPDWRAVATSKIMEVGIPEDGVEVLLFAGPALVDVVRRFNLYCGGGCLPPKWGLGFWHRTPLQYTDSDVLREIAEFETNGFPLDVIGLEPGWLSSSYPTTCEWHRTAFSNPSEFLKQVTERNVKINLWENLYIHPDCELGHELKPMSGSHTGSWGGYCPDLNMHQARAAIANHHEDRHVSIGVSGYKLDECDDDNWIFPDYAEFPSGISGEKLHQVYGTLIQRTTTELFRRNRRRTYGLVRATNAGTVSFPYVVYNDCYDHREYITGLCSGTLSGVLFTPEARDAKSAEEWLRRFQATCFSPLAQLNAWASGTKPWDFAEVAEDVKRTIILRTRLIPYLYSAYAKYHAEGTPPFRALILESETPDDSHEYRQGELDGTENPYSQPKTSDVTDQYMIGPDLLVAPLFAGEKSRTVELPGDSWFDFYTGVYVGQNCVIDIPASFMQIPLFVRDGGLIPMFANDYLHVPGSGVDTPIEIRHYGEREGETELYDDDGETFEFEHGEYKTWKLRASMSGRNNKLTGESREIAGTYTSGYSQFTWRFMSAETEAET